MARLAGTFRLLPFRVRQILFDIPFEVPPHFPDMLPLPRSELCVLRLLPTVFLEPIRPAALGLMLLATLVELLPHLLDMLFLLRSEGLPPVSLEAIRPAPLPMKRLPLAIAPLLWSKLRVLLSATWAAALLPVVCSPLRGTATLVERLLAVQWRPACGTPLLSLPLFLWLPARGYCSCE